MTRPAATAATATGGQTYTEILRSSLSGNDLDPCHEVVHDGVVDLLSDYPLRFLRLVDVQQVD